MRIESYGLTPSLNIHQSSILHNWIATGKIIPHIMSHKSQASHFSPLSFQMAPLGIGPSAGSEPQKGAFQYGQELPG